jgi:hypothetical protein
LRDLNAGLPAGMKMTLLKEGLWYNVKLSVKRYDRIAVTGTLPVARVAGKVWVQGQLEPADWTVGPTDDEDAPLACGYAFFAATGNDLLVDDVYFDPRAIRPLPRGMRVDLLYPEAGIGFQAGDLVNPDGPSPFNFPLVFRPDGTAAKRYVVLLTDTTSNDRRYIVVEQNTGRTRPVDKKDEALKQ